jgi:hypothetical protein
MESYQYFIIWNHGFEHLEKIMDIIRQHPSLKITRVFKKKINLNDFIKNIYKLDKSSYQHIEDKSKYLQSIKPQVFIIFVKDIDTIYKAKPNTVHKYSYHETYVKWHIRLLFNPRIENKDINITPKLIENVSIQRNWPNNITHNHVIHSSDIEEETLLMIDYFKLDNVFNLKGNSYPQNNVKEIHIDDLLVNTTYKDNINVKETPHYKYLLGNYKNEYNKYIMDHFGTIITYDNLSGAYDELINNFEYGKIVEDKPSYIVCTFNTDINKYVVLDGVHRLSILVNKNIDKVLAYIV